VLQITRSLFHWPRSLQQGGGGDIHFVNIEDVGVRLTGPFGHDFTAVGVDELLTRVLLRKRPHVDRVFVVVYLFILAG